MAQADSVPIANRAPITGASSNPSTKRVPAVGRYLVDQAGSDSALVRSNIWALCYATAVLLLGWWPWNVLLILLLLLCRGKPLRFGAFEVMSSGPFCRRGSSL
jgi:hypothetical protein